MGLDEAIAEAVENYDNPPPNESTTCEWVIYPILLAVGYGRREIVSRFADNGGQYPDYHLLPQSPQAWFLEAKAWSVKLQDGHAQQSLNYANQNGRRWVVLSNGQEWRLYDNQIQGLAADKLVLTASLDEPASLECLLRALGKDSVLNGGLEKFARNSRLALTLQKQLADESSEIMRSIWNLLRRQPGLQNLTRADLVGYFSPGEVTQPDSKVSHHGKAPVVAEVNGGQHKQPIVNPDGSNINLGLPRSSLGTLVTGKKPGLVRFPDGTNSEVQTWKEVAVAVVEWVSRNAGLPPLPYMARSRGGCYLLNTTPHHVKTEMHSFQELVLEGQTVYIHTNQTTPDLLSALRALTEAARQAPDAFEIVLR